MKKTWGAPTRRTFVAMLGAAAAALALREQAPQDEPACEQDAPRTSCAGKTRWIGHC